MTFKNVQHFTTSTPPPHSPPKILSLATLNDTINPSDNNDDDVDGDNDFDDDENSDI